MNLKFYFLSLTAIAFSIAVFSGCDSFTTGKISEGTIEYAVTYPPGQKNDFMTSLMPGAIKYNFKNNEASVDLEISMGIVSTSLISNLNKKEVIQTLKIMGKKYAVVMDTAGVQKMIDKEPKSKITFIEGTKMIAGYNCKHAKVTYESDTIAPFDVYYTEDINIENPNWSSPFRDIKGVLMEFHIKKYGLEMILTAKSVSKQNIEEKVFELSPDYKVVSMEEMDKMFADLN